MRTVRVMSAAPRERYDTLILWLQQADPLSRSETSTIDCAIAALTKKKIHFVVISSAFQSRQIQAELKTQGVVAFTRTLDEAREVLRGQATPE